MSRGWLRRSLLRFRELTFLPGSEPGIPREDLGVGEVLPALRELFED